MYNELVAQYDDKINRSAFHDLNSLLVKTQQTRAELSNLWSNTPRMSPMKPIVQKYNPDVQQLINCFSALVDQIQARCQELEKVEQQQKEQEWIERSVLQQLRGLTPGIQTLLIRISELTGFDKAQVEETILRLLEKHPNLGGYDKLSQVFILGADMPKEIDVLLETYPRERSFEELLEALEQETELTSHELHFLVNQLYKRLETAIRSKVQDSGPEFKSNIDLAHDQGVIDGNETDQFQQFRIIRNQLIHEDREDFPSNLILAVYMILERMENP